MKRTGVIASLAIGLLPAVAGAAPVPVSPRTIEANPVTLGFDVTGAGLASWRGLRGSADRSIPFRALASRTFAGEWSAPLMLSRGVLSHDITLLGSNRFALVTEREQPAGKAHTRSLITLSTGTIEPLVLGPAKVLDRGPRRHVAYDGPRPTRSQPVVAASASGTVVIAWQRSSPHGLSGVWVKTGGGRPRRLGPFGASAALTIAPDGTGLVAWRRGSRVLARVRGASWGPIETVARVGRYSELPSASVAGADGRFAVALTKITRSLRGVRWRSSLHTRDGGWHAHVLQDATFTPTGATSYVTDNLRTLVTMTQDGRFHAVWPGMFGTNAAVDDVAAGPDNRWAATWFDGSVNLATFGPSPGTANGLETERALDGSRVAYDTVRAAPVVIWSQGSAAAGFQIVAG